jgi:hypothetical protein
MISHGRPLRNQSHRGELTMLMELTLERKFLFCIEELLKVFLHPPLYLEREIL